MDTNYPLALKKVLVYEGGYSNHPKDPGGRTLQGITQATYDAFRASKHLPPVKLTAGMMSSLEWEANMAEIYRTRYWVPPACPVLSSGVDACIFDYAVNSGVGRAVRVLQKLTGRPITGRISSEDITAANKRAPAQLVEAICAERLAFMKSLSTWTTFGTGWTNRVNAVRGYCTQLAYRVNPPTFETVVAVPAKAEVPATGKAKTAITTGGGVAGGGASYQFGDWLAAHPIATAGICAAVVVGVAFLFYKLDQWRDQKQLTPMNVPVVPEAS